LLGIAAILSGFWLKMVYWLIGCLDVLVLFYQKVTPLKKMPPVINSADKLNNRCPRPDQERADKGRPQK
jgi:hypothetical protein